jgi:hypothetical protein
MAVEVFDEDGCSSYICEANPIMDPCPEYALPLCEEGSHPASIINELECAQPICESNECPVYDEPLCEEGQVAVNRLGDDGCVVPVCE